MAAVSLWQPYWSNQWGPLITDAAIKWHSLIAAKSCYLAARGAGERRQPVSCPAEGSGTAGTSLRAWGNVQRHMFPQSSRSLVRTVRPLQMLSEGFSWGRRCQGHRGDEMVAAPQTMPCHNGKGWKGQGEVRGGRKAPGPCAGYFWGMWALLELDLCPMVNQVTLNPGQPGQRYKPNL